jgi:molybdopterin-containing oxidoreductase family membrane subunit
MDAPETNETTNEHASGAPAGAVPERQETGRYPGSAVLAPGYTYASVTDKISTIVLTGKTPRGWLLGFGLAFALVMLLLYAISYLLIAGVGIWGVNVPVAWGFAIINFVWWIGIGHAGTLISAILLLLHQDWRTSINRFAEAMTLFAVACAGIFPLIHLGRPWFSRLGRLRRVHLCFGVVYVLVRGVAPRLGDAA